MNIFHKIQLATLIAIVSSVSILVYVDQAYAYCPGEDTDCNPSDGVPIDNNEIVNHPEKLDFEKVRQFIDKEINSKYDNWSRYEISKDRPLTRGGPIVGSDPPIHFCVYFKADNNLQWQKLVWLSENQTTPLERATDNYCETKYYPKNNKIVQLGGPILEEPRYAPPTKQFRDGVGYTDVLCNEQRILKFKERTFEPVCIRAESVIPMMERDIIVSWVIMDTPRTAPPEPNAPSKFITENVGIIRDKSVKWYFPIDSEEKCKTTFEGDKYTYEWINGECKATNCENCKRSPIKATFGPPIDQLKYGIGIQYIKCNEGLSLNHKVDTLEPVCLSPESESKLVGQGKIKMRFLLPGSQVQLNLCDMYGGEVREQPRGEGKKPHTYCHNIQTPLICEAIGGGMHRDGACSINPNALYRPR